MGMATNLFLARTDELGDTLWLKTFGTVEEDRGGFVEVCPNGDYILAGGFDTTAILVQTDSNGNELSRKSYLMNGATYAFFNNVTFLENGNLTMCGSIFFPDMAKRNQMYLVVVDADGELIWERDFGGGLIPNWGKR